MNPFYTIGGAGPPDPSRRDLLAFTVGLGSLLDRASTSPGVAGTATRAGAQTRLTALPLTPDRVFIDHDGTRLVAADRRGTRYQSPQASVQLDPRDTGVDVRISCPQASLSRVVLRWDKILPVDALFLGDHWERGYGDLQWRHPQPERAMPWYFAAHHVASGGTLCVGVKTQPNALCFWTVDAEGVSLWLDLRNGGSPSLPGDREIAAATIVSALSTSGETPVAALKSFCRLRCPAPRLAGAPICGNNK